MNSLERHPLSADFTDISGPRWEQFVKDVKDHGVIGRSIKLFEGKVIDGWQLLRACRDAGIEPPVETLELPDGMTVQDWIRIQNENRRHETPKQHAERLDARRRTALLLHQQGKATRAISQELGVSQTTVMKDIGAAGSKKPQREPGDDTESEKKRKPRRPTADAYDWKHVDEAIGVLRRAIDDAARQKSAMDSPEAMRLTDWLKLFREDLKLFVKKMQG